jgi:single-strand DNA-binding protein
LNFNKVLLGGNLTRDPQMKFLANQTGVAEFGLAVNRRWKGANGEDREEVLFVDCAAFGKTAETINQYFTKGKPIFVEGRLKFDSWEDKNGGGKRSKLSVVVDHFQFVGSKEGGATDGHDPQATAKAYPRAAATSAPTGRDKFKPKAADPPFGDEQQFREDDIPFPAPTPTGRQAVGAIRR